jgi:mono/diheme cytochrome c family protein
MTRSSSLRSATLAVLTAAAALGAPAAASAQALPNGEQLYVQRCAACHDQGLGGAPARTVISTRSHDSIVTTLSTGVMQPMASGLKPEEIAALATYLALEKPALANPDGPSATGATPSAAPPAAPPASPAPSR